MMVAIDFDAVDASDRTKELQDLRSFDGVEDSFENHDRHENI